jgi:hypothetical protein
VPLSERYTGVYDALNRRVDSRIGSLYGVDKIKTKITMIASAARQIPMKRSSRAVKSRSVITTSI